MNILLSKNELAEKSGLSWHQVQKLIADGVVRPRARISGRSVFSPDDVKSVRRAITQTTPPEVEAAL